MLIRGRHLGFDIGCHGDMQKLALLVNSLTEITSVIGYLSSFYHSHIRFNISSYVSNMQMRSGHLGFRYFPSWLCMHMPSLIRRNGTNPHFGRIFDFEIFNHFDSAHSVPHILKFSVSNSV